MCERKRERKCYFSLFRALLRHVQNEGQKVRKVGEERTKKRKMKGEKRERKRENDGSKKLIGKERQKKTEQRKGEKTIPVCRMLAVGDNTLMLSCLSAHNLTTTPKRDMLSSPF